MLPVNIAGKVFHDLGDKPRRLIDIHGIHRFENPHGVTLLAAGFDEGTGVFWKTASAVTDAWKKERRANPRIRGQSATDGIHIGADGFAQIRDLIHERN